MTFMTYRKAYHEGRVVGVYFMGYTISLDEIEDMAKTLGYTLVKEDEK